MADHSDSETHAVRNISWPGRWQAAVGARRRRAVLGLVLAACVLLGGLVLLTVGPVHGLLVVLLALVLFSVVLTGWVDGGVSGRSRTGAVRSTTYGEVTGSLIPHSVASSASWYATLLLSTLLFASLPWFAMQVDFTSSIANWLFNILSLVSPLIALWYIALLFSSLVRGFRPKGLTFTPQGVVHTFWFGSCSYAWEGISTIAPDVDDQISVLPKLRGQLTIELNANIRKPVPGFKENRIERWIFLRERMRSIPVERLAIHPAVTYRALEFYLEHPALRDELGTEAGVHRIRNADFSVDDTENRDADPEV